MRRMTSPADPNFIFNSDLLQDDRNREAARHRFPDIFFALDNPELRALFRPIDGEANTAKRRGRRWGVAAVALVTGALLVATVSSQHREESAFDIAVAAIAAAAGLIGVGIGAFGILFGDSKQHWLERRYQSERLRQFHFQYLHAHAADIVKAAQSKDHTDYVNARKHAVEAFALEHIQGVKGKLSALLTSRDDDATWMAVDGAKPKKSKALDQLADALTLLRLNHQIAFTEEKLREDHQFFSSSPLKQVAVFSTAALVCVVGVVVLHFLVLYSVIGNIGALMQPGIHTLAIWFAILALAARTLEEGFQSQREVERYREYNAALRRVRRNLGAAADAAGKLAAMRELEEITYAEMVSFLKSNHEARFVM